MKLSPAELKNCKGVKAIPMLTAYNSPVARALEQAGIPVILVGDTVGMVEMGFDSTRHVTVEHMEYHIGAVRRGAPGTHIIGDLPYLADADQQTAEVNAKRLLAAGADSVKLEGDKYAVISHLVGLGIAVVGHTGLLPQTATNFSKVGKNQQEAKRIRAEAQAIQDAGAFMLVIEHVPYDLAAAITDDLTIPTIGIGAGPDCDGQVLVINDALGLGDYWPPFSKQYAHASDSILAVAKRFSHEVEAREFPNNILRSAATSK